MSHHEDDDRRIEPDEDPNPYEVRISGEHGPRFRTEEEVRSWLDKNRRADKRYEIYYQRKRLEGR
ncbi:hypothetical protein GCM10011611_30010 [Aliidongia dinghuensis]|uniref:Uncharacterized protein n=1 Tax=Aliidongia dinghuensis TaxID=1867774 RepID=A0A8J3E5I2_9PROT|nr:hypothetical protein [Aliidongia dinghuensis]GGF21942.1 hypothetical protein GCM10011611_30010 [Aliidongia dinghuensis]